MSFESTGKDTDDTRFTSSGKDITTDSEYKKTFQVVDRPGLTSGLNDEGITDPPQNVPVGQPSLGAGQKYPRVEKEVDEYELENGEEGPGTGRPKKLDVQKELIGDSETTT